MTEKTTCSCGQNEAKRLIFPCAGQSNAGQLTNLAAIQLTEEGYGKIVCTSLLATGNKGIVKSARNADEVVVLDGCPMSCAAKIAENQGVKVGQNIIVTELGIAKGPSKSYTTDDIEKVVAACWAGEGRSEEAEKKEKKDSDTKISECGCGCGRSCE
ncbi:MAG TPA: putative zinc-binding protein [Methanocorpusculum sp.]|nr:putative zinc-binding protein [Methanocorpusculum sp.]